AGEIRDGHQLDGGDAGIGHMVELVDRGAKRALRRERADMQLEDYGIVPWPPAPLSRVPIEPMIDHLARAVHVVRLERGRWIRHRKLAVDAEAVERSGASTRHGRRVPPAGTTLHRKSGRLVGRLTDQQLDLSGGRRR